MPAGLPSTRPSTTPVKTSARQLVPRRGLPAMLTPALARANNGITRKVLHPWRRSCSQTTGGPASSPGRGAGFGTAGVSSPTITPPTTGWTPAMQQAEPDHRPRQQIGQRPPDSTALQSRGPPRMPADADCRVRQRDTLRVDEGDDQDGGNVIDDGDGQQQDAQARRHPVAEQGQDADREGDVRGGRYRPARQRPPGPGSGRGRSRPAAGRRPARRSAAGTPAAGLPESRRGVPAGPPGPRRRRTASSGRR